MALWRGWVPSVIGVVPYVGLNFCVYESLKDVVIQMTGAHPHASMACRALSLCCSTWGAPAGWALGHIWADLCWCWGLRARK